MSATVLAPLVWRPSPNHSTRHGEPITHLVWHATIGRYLGAIETLRDPASDASAHLCVREDGGETAQLVKLSEKAWHAYPYWNAKSIGVEHASLHRGFASHDQLEQSARLFAYLCHLEGIPAQHGMHKPRGIVRHRDLGAVGGGHFDGPDDHVWFDVFLPLVRHELARGGFRKEYTR
jgi:N-acetyl-anhydromuramyl-L-alanine amidase AmpD